jgi:DNA replication licensing factor MCM5
MEQQTISVAKAGITTILNSRAAVLAAANPVFGRYDDTRSAADNIDLLPTILSRFDLIFIVRDIRNERRDQEIARHVMRVHMSAATDDRGGAAAAEDSGLGGGAAGVGSSSAASSTGEIDIATLKKFISYARTKVAPRLSVGAATALQAAYVGIRQGAKSREADARSAQLATSEEHGVIPITVRQLEALVRITEAVAKSTLSLEANEAHVEVRVARVCELQQGPDLPWSGVPDLVGGPSHGFYLTRRPCPCLGAAAAAACCCRRRSGSSRCRR